MNQSTSHDTPAGKTLAEHRALHVLLGEVEKATSDPAAAAADAALTGRLDTLRERLAAHFQGEEESGLFEQIEEMAPEHAHDCESLCEEHEGLLSRLDELRAVESGARDRTFTDGVRTLLDDLASHETRENEILTRVLDGGDQAQD
jgi:iron-sulfur cluster repair protein YtfE (RIC family)